MICNINITIHITFNILGIHVRFSTYINAIFFTSSEYFGPISLKIRFCFHNYWHVNLHDVYNLRTFDDTWLYAFLQLFKNACIKTLMHQKVVWNLLSDKFLLIYLLWIMLSLFILNFRRLLCMHGWFRDGSKRLIHWGCTDCTDCTDS